MRVPEGVKVAAKRVVGGTPLEPAARRMLQLVLAGNPFKRGARDNRRMARIIARVLRADSNCVDVGSSYGDILKLLIRAAPQGRHFAFEAIPSSAALLRARYPKAEVFELAVSDAPGEREFFHVRSDPGYSGLQRRPYPRADFRVQTIQVRTDTLDNVLPADVKIDLIKIDVEGAELQVLRGALRTVDRCHPYILFEHGQAASQYGTTPDMVYELLVDACGMTLWKLQDWLRRGAPLTREAFVDCLSEPDSDFLAAP